ncbi:MAG: hypothetical protein NDI67_03315 [Sulfuritalea sp.]|nr:hypothetical protein [Sulfuritalea sp.]
MDPIFQAITAGLFGLLGGFAGAALTRRTDYEKWLRQEKSTTFAEFLRQMHDARENAIETLYSTSLDEQLRSIKLTEIFLRLSKQESVARLYLNNTSRESLSKLRKELWLLHATRENQADRIGNAERVMNEIQNLLESQLH